MQLYTHPHYVSAKFRLLAGNVVPLVQRHIPANAGQQRSPAKEDRLSTVPLPLSRVFITVISVCLPAGVTPLRLQTDKPGSLLSSSSEKRPSTTQKSSAQKSATIPPSRHSDKSVVRNPSMEVLCANPSRATRGPDDDEEIGRTGSARHFVFLHGIRLCKGRSSCGDVVLLFVRASPLLVS